MTKSTPTTYYRIDTSCQQSGVEPGIVTISLPDGLETRLRPGHGLVIAEWNERSLMGEVKGLGVVRSVDPQARTAEVVYVDTEIHLKPNPSGRRYWRNPYLCFAKDVLKRYMLEDLFAEHFPDYAGIEFEMPESTAQSERAERDYQKVGGYVYVIRSNYGFKIGKTVNIKKRVRLFEVKLPFPIELESYAWFDNYSAAEARFHRYFADKRTEGEWFNLEPEDLAFIRNQGDQVSTKNL